MGGTTPLATTEETSATQWLPKTAMAPQDRAALLLKEEALKENKNQTFVFYSSENRYIMSG